MISCFETAYSMHAWDRRFVLFASFMIREGYMDTHRWKFS
jgi:hypothetical protein